MIIAQLDIGRELKFSTYALMKVEEELGINLIGGNIFEDLSVTKIIVLTWAASLHSHKKLTLETVAGWIDLKAEGQLEGLINKLVEAFLVYQGVSPEEVQKKMKEMSMTQKVGNAGKTGKSSKPSE